MSYIIIGSDHGGFELKKCIVDHLQNKCKKYIITDIGVFSDASIDYPDICRKLINTYYETLKKSNDVFCIVICGTGIGVSISCNKYHNIRCALCHNKYTAEMAKKHNNANVIAIGGRIITVSDASDIVDTYIQTQFEGGRHQRRLDKIEQY